MRATGAVLLVGLVLLLWAGDAGAIDYLPFDYVAPPPGTTAVLGYYLYGSRSGLNSNKSGNISSGTSLDSHIGAVRLVHYEELFEHPVAVQAILPFGALTDAKLGGVPIDDAFGMGDPILTLAFWPVSQPQERRWLVIANYLSFPVGDYEPGKALNIGGNRWQDDVQVGLIQGLPGGFTLDMAFDLIVYGPNQRAGTGQQTLRQQSTFEAYGWLAYNVTPQLFTALGWAGTFGGEQRLDSVPNGLKTHVQQVRGSVGYAFAPSWQVVGEIGRDISTSGGFPQDVALTFRLLKVF